MRNMIFLSSLLLLSTWNLVVCRGNITEPSSFTTSEKTVQDFTMRRNKVSLQKQRYHLVDVSVGIPTNQTYIRTTVTPIVSPFSVFKTLTKIVCVLVIIFGVLGNSLVLLIFGCRWSRLKPFEVYMVNLAIADLIGTAVFPSIQLHTLLDGSFHYIGKAGCKIIYFLTTLSLTESALTLIVISVDRYFIVSRPFRERVSKLTITLIITLTWGLSSLLGITHLIGDRMVLHNAGNETMVCRVSYKTEKDHTEGAIFTILMFAVQNGIPLIALVTLYSLIAIKLRQTQDQAYNLECVRSRKTIKLLIVIVIAFFICVTPSNIFYLIYYFNEEIIPGYQIYPIYAFLTMLLMTNSCINPVIYAKLHATFRRTAKRLLCCCFAYRRNVSEGNGGGGGGGGGFREFHTAITATLRYPSDDGSSNGDDSHISLREITHQVKREELVIVDGHTIVDGDVTTIVEDTDPLI